MEPRLRRSTINSFYNDYSIYNFIKGKVSVLSGTTLDIGCGKMRYKDLILKSEPNRKYIGLDLEEGKFTYSVKADLYWDGIKIPLENNKVNNVLISEVLEHCPDPKIVLSEAFRILKQDGNILITIPFLYQLHGIPHDFNRMTPYLIEKYLNETGFSKIDMKPSGGFDASLAQMLGIWISHRPMNINLRRILRIPSILVFRTLLYFDKNSNYNNIKENFIMPGLLISAKK